MHKNLCILLTFLTISTLAAPIKVPTVEESEAEMRAAGMTEASIDGLLALTRRFVTEFPLVQENKEKAYKFIAEYTIDSNNFIRSMPQNDQAIYNNFLKKYGFA